MISNLKTIKEFKLDTASVRKFLNSTHTPGLHKLEIFYNNKSKNKPLKWWLQQMDEMEASDTPFNISQFLSKYKMLSSKKYAFEYIDEVLDWAMKNKQKFKNGLQHGNMKQYRQNITKNEQQEQQREKEDEAGDKKAFSVIASFLNKTSKT